MTDPERSGSSPGTYILVVNQKISNVKDPVPVLEKVITVRQATADRC